MQIKKCSHQYISCVNVFQTLFAFDVNDIYGHVALKYLKTFYMLMSYLEDDWHYQSALFISFLYFH